jgi:stalled ribosome rescue protein Dom34
MNFTHAIVWLDHQRAQVIRFNRDASESADVHAHGGAVHLHHKHGAVGSGHAPENHKYYEELADALKGMAKVLVTGPASAKNEFVKHVEAHDKSLAKSIAGVETADHPSAGELLAKGRKWFEKYDQSHGGPGLR